MSSNQGLWADFGVVEELTEQAAETISGGAESFTIVNNTNANIPFTIDGYLFGLQPGYEGTFATTGNGIIVFDRDVQSGIQANSYDLDDGGRYVFLADGRTATNPYDFDLGYIA
jgi:hypothetical protein